MNTQKTIINFPLIIPTVLIDSGAIELYARRRANWQPKVNQQTTNEDGTITDTEIDNPESAKDACIRYLQEFVKNDYRQVHTDSNVDIARAKAGETFDSLFA